MSSEESKRVVRAYFDALQSGGERLPELLAEDVSWWVPPGSDFAGLHEGRQAVLEFLGGGVGYYADDPPLRVEVESLIAEGSRVACEFTITAKTAAGRDYLNHYHFAFEVENGRIRRVREYLDTHYAHEAFHR